MTARVFGAGRDEPVTVWDHPPTLVFYPQQGVILNPRQDDVCDVWTGPGMRGWWLDPDGVGFGTLLTRLRHCRVHDRDLWDCQDDYVRNLLSGPGLDRCRRESDLLRHGS